MPGARKRVPEHFRTSIRKVEPVGGDVRLYFAMERGGAWDVSWKASRRRRRLASTRGVDQP
jgi:hypothetical protein